MTLALNSLFLSAQVNFDASVSKTKLGLNERLRVDFVMNQNGDNFSPPDFENFQIIGGPNQSIKTSYVNGERSFSKTYSYFLQPLKKGSIIIKQASIEIDGEEYKSLPIEVLITDSVSQPSESVTQYYNDDDIELRALISKGSPYLNEPIRAQLPSRRLFLSDIINQEKPHEYPTIYQGFTTLRKQPMPTSVFR